MFEIVERRRQCPHENVAECPLYRAAHYAHGFGCDTGRMEIGCGVDLGEMSYAEAVAIGEDAGWGFKRVH